MLLFRAFKKTSVCQFFPPLWMKIVRERIGFSFERTQIPYKHVAFGTFYNKQSGFVFVYILTLCTRAHSVGAKMTAIMAQKCCKLGDNIFPTKPARIHTHAVRKCWLACGFVYSSLLFFCQSVEKESRMQAQNAH